MRLGAEALQLGRDLLHVPGRQELALLDVDRPAGLGRGAQQVGLAAEEGGDLQDVDHLGHGLALPALVDVGEHRQAGGLLHRGQDLDALVEPDAAGAGGAGAVGLVERALVDQRHAQPVGQPLELARHGQRVLAALDRAWPGDQRQRQVVGDGDLADLDGALLGHHTSLDCSTAARMKAANRGCGAIGRDFSSGWNCTPTNQGWPGSSIISGRRPSGDMPEKRRPAPSSTGR